MKIHGQHYKTIWFDNKNKIVKIIDQTKLPHEFEIVILESLSDVVKAIKNMLVRGAPLIGATAAFGLYLACRENDDIRFVKASASSLVKARPTAVNLSWAINRVMKKIVGVNKNDLLNTILNEAISICNEDINFCERIGNFGLNIIKDIKKKNNLKVVNILTHCNAGWLATIDWGTATSPIYKAHKEGIDIHVWVDETRPRNQGSSLTSFELNHEQVPNTIIVDNAGGLLMQQGKVDLCITGTDRVTSSGHVANKIGTYLKALSAYDNNIPFYVALPSSTIDWSIANIEDVPIEIRDNDELNLLKGLDKDGNITEVDIYPKFSKMLNLAFDVTPNKYITGLITERGLCMPNSKSLFEKFK